MATHLSTGSHRGRQIGQLLVGAILSLAVVDCGLRIIEGTPLWRVFPVVEPILGHPDSEIGFDSTPGAKGVWPIEHRSFVRINSLGLRDVERQRAKPAGSLRVGLLGDSMVEATQVSQEATFGTLAEGRLRAEGYNIELLNLAVAGPNPIRQLLRLEKRGYALNLDWVVANSSGASFVSGLLLDDSQNPAYADAGDGRLVRGYAFRQRLSQRYADYPLGHLFVALYQHSPLFRLLYLHMKKPWPELLGLPAAQATPRPVPAAATSACDAAMAMLEPHVGLWRDHRPARAWAATMQFLDDFAASTRSHGVQVLYAVRDIPVSPLDCPLADGRRAELLSAMAAEFARRGMRFVDWSDAVAENLQGRDMRQLHGFGVQRGQGHLNYDGHRVWATTLVNALRSELLGGAASAK